MSRTGPYAYITSAIGRTGEPVPPRSLSGTTRSRNSWPTRLPRLHICWIMAVPPCAKAVWVGHHHSSGWSTPIRSVPNRVTPRRTSHSADRPADTGAWIGIQVRPTAGQRRSGLAPRAYRRSCRRPAQRRSRNLPMIASRMSVAVQSSSKPGWINGVSGNIFLILFSDRRIYCSGSGEPLDCRYDVH
jgi:hypothetical protein